MTKLNEAIGVSASRSVNFPKKNILRPDFRISDILPDLARTTQVRSLIENFRSYGVDKIAAQIES